MSVRARIRQRSFEGPAHEAVLSLQVAAAHVEQRVGALCARHGITHDQYNALRILRGAHPDGHPRYEIARRLISQGPGVTRLLDRLERHGLVERVRADDDRRLSITRITDAGLELLAGMDPEIRELDAELTAKLTQAEMRTLAELCSAIVP